MTDKMNRYEELNRFLRVYVTLGCLKDGPRVTGSIYFSLSIYSKIK